MTETFYVTIGPLIPQASKYNAHIWKIMSEDQDLHGFEIFATVNGKPEMESVIEIMQLYDDTRYREVEE